MDPQTPRKPDPPRWAILARYGTEWVEGTVPLLLCIRESAVRDAVARGWRVVALESDVLPPVAVEP